MLTAPGLDVVGPFPPELHENVVFTAALSEETKQASAAKALLNYLKKACRRCDYQIEGDDPGIEASDDARDRAG